jgi:hypothetical protein
VLVDGPGFVAEHTLNGPDVLCRYWGDKPPSADAYMIAAAPDMLTELQSLWLLYGQQATADVIAKATGKRDTHSTGGEE